MSATYLDLEEPIHRTMAAILAMSELLDATLTNPDKVEGTGRLYLLTDAQVDARLEIMSHAVEQATGLREMFRACTRGERARKAMKP